MNNERINRIAKNVLAAGPDPRRDFLRWCDNQTKKFGPFGRQITVQVRLDSDVNDKEEVYATMNCSSTGSMKEKDIIDHVKNIEEAKSYFLKMKKEADRRFADMNK